MAYYTYSSSIVFEHLCQKNKNVNSADLATLEILNTYRWDIIS
jgi:hypothetical protein